MTTAQKNVPTDAGDVDASRGVIAADISATRRMGNASVRRDSWVRSATQNAQEEIMARTARCPASANTARTVRVILDDATVDQDGAARAAKSALATLLADKMKKKLKLIRPFDEPHKTKSSPAVLFQSATQLTT